MTILNMSELELQPFDWRAEWRRPVIVAFLLVATYAATMPPGVVFEDAGMIAASCYRLGILHPPGYPLYSLLCAPVSQLADVPWLAMEPAQAASLFSGMCAAAAAALLYEVARRFQASARVAFCISLMFGLGSRVWSQAIIPEVYALNVLLLAAMLVMVLRLMHTPSPKQWLCLFFICGLGLANHWPLFITALPAFAVFLISAKQFPSAKTMLLCIPALLVGLSPYMYMVLRPMWGDTLSLYAPPHDIASLVSYISREQYILRAAAETAASDNEWQCADNALFALQLLLKEHAYIGAAAAAFGAAMMLRLRPLWCIAVLSGVAFTAPVLGWYLCGDLQTETGKAVFAAYPLPAMMFLSIWVIAALNCIRHPANAVIAAALLAATVTANWQSNDRSQDRFAREYASAILASLPPDASLTIQSDLDFPVLYMRHALGERPDIAFTNFHAGNSNSADADARKRRFQTGATLPVNSSDWGIVHEVLSEDAADESIPEVLIEFYARLPDRFAEAELRQWDKLALQHSLFSAGRALTKAKYKGELLPQQEQAREATVQTPDGLFGSVIAELRASGGNATALARLRNSLILLKQSAKYFSPARRAELLHVEGRLHLHAGEWSLALAKLQESVRIDGSHRNPALVDMLQMLAQSGNWQEYGKWRSRHAGASLPALVSTDAKCRQAGVCAAQEENRVK